MYKAKTEHRKDSAEPGRESQTNGFQNGKIVFKTKTNLDYEQCIKIIPPPTQDMEF